MDYDLAKEQAKLSLAIQDARREFQTLKDEKEAWLQEREAETIERVTRALERAKEAVEEANSYTGQVEKLRQETENLTKEIKDSWVLMQKARREFNRHTIDTRNIIDKKTEELEEFTAETRQAEMKINGLLEKLRLERGSLAEEQKKVNDDRAKLAVAMKIWQTQRETTTE